MEKRDFSIVVSYQAVGIDKKIINSSFPVSALCDFCSQGITNCNELRRQIREHHNTNLHAVVATEIKIRRDLPPTTKIKISRILLFSKKAKVRRRL